MIENQYRATSVAWRYCAKASAPCFGSMEVQKEILSSISNTASYSGSMVMQDETAALRQQIYQQQVLSLRHFACRALTSSSTPVAYNVKLRDIAKENNEAAFGVNPRDTAKKSKEDRKVINVKLHNITKESKEDHMAYNNIGPRSRESQDRLEINGAKNIYPQEIHDRNAAEKLISDFIPMEI